ncbi:MAG: cell division protein FtsL [Desulfobacula sp.]|nr:cell division protein FtsL [Desulfobacula sp.]
MTIKNNISKKTSPPQSAGFRWIIVISIIFCELLAYTWVRTETTQTMLRISKAERNLIKNQSYHTALVLEIDRLKSEDRITRIATSRLNLFKDSGDSTYYLSKDPI